MKGTLCEALRLLFPNYLIRISQKGEDMRVHQLLRCAGKSSFGAKVVDPLVFNVPVFCQRPIGRDTDVHFLWQNLLSGKKVQTITGLDGIGKSTLASQFCECAKKSGRFSCIQWFNAEYALEDQLREFVRLMKTRSEKEVLLVFDDVDHVDKIIQLLPQHENIFSLILSQSPSGGVHAQSVGPLQQADAEELAGSAKSAHSSSQGSDVDDVKLLTSELGNVPLLLTIASGLLEMGFADGKAISTGMKDSGAFSNGVLCVSAACKVLVKVAVGRLSTEHPYALKALATASVLHISDLSPIIFDAAAGEDTSEFCRKAQAAGVLSHKWETDSFALHRVVAKALLGLLEPAAQVEVARDASQKLLTLWPRRTRSAGSALTESLVWHSLALRNSFRLLNIAPTEELVTCLDRSATYLAQSEGRHLGSAVDMWEEVVTYYKSKQEHSIAQVEAAWNCGRLLHFQRKVEAAPMLKHAFESACAVHGRSSAEASLILACYAPYLDASASAAEMLLEAATALQQPRPSASSSKADQKMAKESSAVLLMRYAQMFGELGSEVPPHVMPRIEQLRQELLRMK